VIHVSRGPSTPRWLRSDELLRARDRSDELNLTFRRRRAAMANCLARHAARRVSDPGRAINYRLKPSLVRSAFESCRAGPKAATV
jgi:hypothetical protein